MTLTKDNDAQIVDGSLLIEENTLFPESSSPNDRTSIGNGWSRINNNVTFEKQLADAGWTFFFMAGTIRTSVLGFEHQRMIQTAVKRLLAKVTREKCNCLEIDHIAMDSFCGMSLVTVLGHSRHISAGAAFCGAGV
jgi:hypothetical protein